MEFCAERGLCVGNTYLSTEVWINTQGWQGSRRSGGKEHGRSVAGEKGYAALCTGCVGGERNGMRPFRPPCCTYKVRLVEAWIKRRELVVGVRRIRNEKLRNISTEKDMLGLLRGRE